MAPRRTDPTSPATPRRPTPGVPSLRRASSRARAPPARAGGGGGAAARAGWCALFSPHYGRLRAAADTSRWEVAPGAHEAIARLDRRALLTGNPPAVAHARMERLGLAGFFPPGEGAFGCERDLRSELFALARERAGGWPADH